MTKKATSGAPKFNFGKGKDKDNDEKEDSEINNLESIISVFEVKLKKNRKRLKKSNQDLGDSAGNLAVLKSLLEMMVGILPMAERVYVKYKNERAAYAIVALVTQVREISADIQRYSNVNKNGEVILEKIIMPTMQLILQHYLNSCAMLIKDLETSKKLTPNNARKLVNKSIERFGDYMKEITHSITDKTASYFNDK